MAPLWADVPLQIVFRLCWFCFVCLLSVWALLWMGAWLLSFFVLGSMLPEMLGYLLSSVPCGACMLAARCIGRMLLLT